ncbi:hypothetical protein TWF481_000455 [Arthrobotrys musiformis]|uniref:Uncharacterized protein n=1 Tax=Arthrobotrys musiformis TaxID=47236 RepID=A0AAV9WPG3_9PEZI
MSHINIPHPSPRSSLPSTSPIHFSSPSSAGWRHIISVAQAFSDRLSQLPQETPVATNRRWSQRCRDKGITGTKTPATGAGTARYSPAVPPVASAALFGDGSNGTQTKRRRGRPAGSRGKKSIPPAIVAAKENLRQISEISDRQWGHEEPEVAKEPQDEHNQTQPPRRSTRSVRRRATDEKTAAVGQPNTPNPAAEPASELEPVAELEPAAEPAVPEPEPDVGLNIEADIEAPPEPRTSRKQPAAKHIKPSTLFFFTTLPKPTPPGQAKQSNALSFSFSMQPLGHRRALTSDNVVMLCMRARVRKQKRMREAGVARSATQLPRGCSLKRNLHIMRRRMEKINHKKGKQVDREVGSAAEVEEAQEQHPNDNDIDTSRGQIHVEEEAGASVQRRGRKRKRKAG